MCVFLIGAKVDDPCCYGHTQFHLMPERLNRDRMSELHSEKQLEVTLRANAIASLFAWTGAQAMYQGKSYILSKSKCRMYYELLEILL